MARESVFEVTCPCCQGTLKIDPELRAVIHHQAYTKPAAVEDLTVAMERLKGEAARREEAFQKSFSEQKNRAKLLDSKFDELLKQAKADPDQGPPRRDFDLD